MSASAAAQVTTCSIGNTVYSNIFEVHNGLSGDVVILYKAGVISVQRGGLSKEFLKSWGLNPSWVLSTNTGNIEIDGTSQFIDQVSNALVLLKRKAPDAYIVVTNYVKVIRQAAQSGMLAYANPPCFEMQESIAFPSLTWCASSIAHDSIHSKLYNDYQNTHFGEVPVSIWTGKAAEHQCLAFQTKVLKEIGAPEDEIRYCSQIPDDFYDTAKYKTNFVSVKMTQ